MEWCLLGHCAILSSVLWLLAIGVLSYTALLSCLKEQSFEESWRRGGLIVALASFLGVPGNNSTPLGGESHSPHCPRGKLGHRTVWQPHSRCPSNWRCEHLFFQRGVPGILLGSLRPVLWVTRQPGLLRSPTLQLITPEGAWNPTSKLTRLKNSTADNLG